MQYLVMNMEVCWGLERSMDVHHAIQSALDDLRGEGAARAVAFRILDNDDEYEKWYKNHGIHEVIIPTPTTISFD